MSNRSLSRSESFPLWLSAYIMLIGILTGSVLASMAGPQEIEWLAILSGCGFGSMFGYYKAYRSRPEAFVMLILFSLAIILMCANDLAVLWLPTLRLSVAFAWYQLLAPVTLIIIGGLYPTFYGWRDRGFNQKV